MSSHKVTRRLVARTLEGERINKRYGAWDIRHTGEGIHILRHYSTDMLMWCAEGSVEFMKIGYGSKSDQEGVNAALDTLDSIWYYSRKGYPHYIER